MSDEQEDEPLIVPSLIRPLVVGGLRRRFHAIRFLAADPEAWSAGGPLLVAANHTNWWDGFVAWFVTESLGGRRFGILQEEAHLRRYPWFRRCGVIGIDLRGGAAAIGGLRRARRFLGHANSALWIFPGGRLSRPGAPVAARPGTGFLAGPAGARVLPAAVHYEWFDQSRPTVLVRFGRCLDSSPNGAGPEAESVGRAIEDGERLLDEAVVAGEAGRWRPLMRPGRSINEWWDDLRRSVGGDGIGSRD